MRHLLLTFVLLTLSWTAVAGGNNADEKKMAMRQGKVVDGKTNEGIAGAMVKIEGTQEVVYTDFDGNFTLPVLPEGQYTLSSTSISYSGVKLRNIKISRDLQDQTIEMRLQPH